jgi:hypothetical protein
VPDELSRRAAIAVAGSSLTGKMKQYPLSTLLKYIKIKAQILSFESFYASNYPCCLYDQVRKKRQVGLAETVKEGIPAWGALIQRERPGGRGSR